MQTEYSLAENWKAVRLRHVAYALARKAAFEQIADAIVDGQLARMFCTRGNTFPISQRAEMPTVQDTLQKMGPQPLSDRPDISRRPTIVGQ